MARFLIPSTQPNTTIMKHYTFPMLVLLTVVAFALDLSLGSVAVPLRDVLRVLLGQPPARATWTTIILTIRLPRVLTATLAGVALATSGLQMQTLFRNALAGPFVLGISSGASLGVALVVVGASVIPLPPFLSGQMSVTLAAILGAFTVMVVVLAVARNVRDGAVLLIVGLTVGYTAGALVSVLLYFARAEQVQAYVIWTFGSFGGVTWPQLRLLALAVGIGLMMAVAAIKPLNALLLGETYAISMGVDVTRARVLIIIGTSLLAGAVTAFCGPIAFLGVAVPHLTRGFSHTSDHRLLVPGVIFTGALAALVADIVTTLPGHSIVLPVNTVTSLVGAPVVLWVILHYRRTSLAEGV